jgi:hypothetical protein
MFSSASRDAGAVRIQVDQPSGWGSSVPAQPHPGHLVAREHELHLELELVVAEEAQQRAQRLVPAPPGRNASYCVRVSGPSRSAPAPAGPRPRRRRRRRGPAGCGPSPPRRRRTGRAGSGYQPPTNCSTSTGTSKKSPSSCSSATAPRGCAMSSPRGGSAPRRGTAAGRRVVRAQADEIAAGGSPAGRSPRPRAQPVKRYFPTPGRRARAAGGGTGRGNRRARRRAPQPLRHQQRVLVRQHALRPGQPHEVDASWAGPSADVSSCWISLAGKASAGLTRKRTTSRRVAKPTAARSGQPLQQPDRLEEAERVRVARQQRRTRRSGGALPLHARNPPLASAGSGGFGDRSTRRLPRRRQTSGFQPDLGGHSFSDSLRCVVRARSTREAVERRVQPENRSSTLANRYTPPPANCSSSNSRSMRWPRANAARARRDPRVRGRRRSRIP